MTQRSLSLSITVAFVCALVLAPALIIFSSWGSIDTALWQHFATNVLWDLIVNTLILTLGVGFGVTLLGVSSAWLISTCDFPGRKYAEWLLMLPLAIPAYVLAFIALGFFDHFGPLQNLLRFFGSDTLLPDIRTPLGVITVMSLVLYPYVYMLARLAFKGTGYNLYLASRNLGYGPWQSFFKLALPVARPSIAAGASLAIMEALADFGAVSVFNFDTFTTAIYKAWFGFFSLPAAAQLSSLLLAFVVLILFVERYLRFRARYHTSNAQRAPLTRLSSSARWAATVWCYLIISTSFIFPLLQLFAWAYEYLEDFTQSLLNLVWHTLLLGGMAAIATLLAAFVLNFNARLYRSRLDDAANFSASLGYALPGSILAVGVMMTLNWVDNQFLVPVISLFQPVNGLILSGTLVGLALAYIVRFLAVANGPIQTAFQRIGLSMTEAAQSLGASQSRIVTRLYLPLLKPGLFTAMLMVVIEVMKEMPATLLLRPFGWDTLAVRIYELTSEGEWERAAVPALFLIMAGLIPVLFLMRRSEK
ncbi:MAG: iron ABC transporter permease [Pseudomonadota bacterium]